MAGVLLARDFERIECELIANYRVALEAGLTREALVVATHLSEVYRFVKQPARAAALLEPLAPSARIGGTRECRRPFQRIVAG